MIRPRLANGRFVTIRCPNSNCDGELRPDRDGWWRCDGLVHEKGPDSPLYACSHVHHPDYQDIAS